MLPVSFNDNPPSRILCLGAHADDIEIGAGGTILKLNQSSPKEFRWVVFSSGTNRDQEAVESANLFLGSSKKKVEVKNFRNGFFPYEGKEIKEFFEELKKEFSPDLIFTHYREDLHQDHRMISDITWNTFRDNLILEYEVPKYDGDFGSPNFFVHLEESVCARKVKNILTTFKTQKDKHWFTEDAFLSVLRLRGIESASPGRYAEAFYCRKVVLRNNS